MENTITQDQIKRLNEIVNLPKEEQQQKLNEFLRSLTQEQVEFLKTQQTQKCLFCSMVDNTIQSKKIYEDEEVITVLDINPATKGHVLVIPKQHVKYSYETTTKIFQVANLFAKKLKEIFNYDSNILINNGKDAGQNIDHLIVHVIPRYKEDKLNFSWQGEKADDNKLNEMAAKLTMKLERKEKEPEKIEEIDYEEEERIP